MGIVALFAKKIISHTSLLLSRTQNYCIFFKVGNILSRIYVELIDKKDISWDMTETKLDLIRSLFWE